MKMFGIFAYAVAAFAAASANFRICHDIELPINSIQNSNGRLFSFVCEFLLLLSEFLRAAHSLVRIGHWCAKRSGKKNSYIHISWVCTRLKCDFRCLIFFETMAEKQKQNKNKKKKQNDEKQRRKRVNERIKRLKCFVWVCLFVCVCMRVWWVFWAMIMRLSTNSLHHKIHTTNLLLVLFFFFCYHLSKHDRKNLVQISKC